MMISRIIKLKKGPTPSFSAQNRRPVIFLICSVLGIALGILTETLSEFSVDLQIKNTFDLFTKTNSAKGFFEIFLGSTFFGLLYILIPLILGLSCVGFTFLYAVPFVKGLGVGAVCAYIYSAYLIKGIGYCALIVFPASAIQFLALILACSESSLMSKDILRLVFGEKSPEKSIKMNMYALRYAVITVISLIGSLLFTLGNMIFFKVI